MQIGDTIDNIGPGHYCAAVSLGVWLAAALVADFDSLFYVLLGNIRRDFRLPPPPVCVRSGFNE